MLGDTHQSEVPGEPWFGQTIADADRTRLRRELGGIVGAMYRIAGTAYGLSAVGPAADVA
jgi:hypothetical protein